MSSSSLSHVSVPAEMRSQLSPWLLRLAYPLSCRLVIPAFFGRVTILGQENIPQKGAVIVTPVHRSRWDALIVPFAIGYWVSQRNLRFMVMSTEMKGFQGWLIHQLGGFPVDIRHPALSSLEYSVELLEREEMVVIFPEGNVFREDKVQPIKRGVARIALEVKAQQPDNPPHILPMSIRYSNPYPHWGTDVTVKIGEALTLDQYDPKTMKTSSVQLTHDLQEILVNLHEGLRGKE